MNNWIAKIAFQKVAKRVVSYAVSALVAGVAASNLDKAGINVSVDPTVATGAAFAGIELLKNFIKVKLKVAWL